MKLEIKSIADRGHSEKERVIMRVLAPTELGNYALVANRHISGEPTTEIIAGYWFPFQKVALGELVVLYTKSGTNRTKKTESGADIHFHYWGRSTPMWDDGEAAALLLEAPEWDMAAPLEQAINEANLAE